MSNLKSKKIAVLCGGRSGEREVSLRSGARVFNSLKSQGYNVVSLDVTPDLINELRSEKIEIVYIMLHGKYGEDGAIQGLLEVHDIAYTGSKILASAIGMHKVASKRIWQAVGIPTPKYYYEDEIENIRQNPPLPLVIKPTSEGSSLGVSIVKTKEGFEKALNETREKFSDVFVEEFIAGQEVTVGILGTGTGLEALPILELVPKAEFYDYKAKYTKGMTDFILPARIPQPLYANVQQIAIAAHEAIGAYGFSRVDIMVDKKGVSYVHEINTIPGMTDLSDLPAEAAHAGISYDELVVKILESAY